MTEEISFVFLSFFVENESMCCRNDLFSITILRRLDSLGRFSAKGDNFWNVVVALLLIKPLL